MPKIPIIESLTLGSIPPGSNLLVEFDPSSQWYNAATTIAGGWLNSGGKLTYLLSSRPPENIRSQLTKLGVNVQDLEGGGKLRIWDAYSATLGLQSQEKYRLESLNVADLRIWAAKEFMHQPVSPDLLLIAENSSVLASYMMKGLGSNIR